MCIFSQNFAALLKERGLSQQEVATLSGIHKQSINRYATGKSLPGWAELLKLAAALGCNLDSFLTGKWEAAATKKDGIQPQLKEQVRQLEETVQRLKDILNGK